MENQQTSWLRIGLTVATLIILPLIVSVIGNVLTPKLQDWWSARSRRATLAEINKLESLIPLGAITMTELAVYCWRRVFLIIAIAVYAFLPAVNLPLLFGDLLHPPPPPYWVKELALFLWYLFYAAPAALAFSSYRTIGILVSSEKRERQQAKIEKRIAQLKAKLT